MIKSPKCVNCNVMSSLFFQGVCFVCIQEIDPESIEWHKDPMAEIDMIQSEPGLGVCIECWDRHGVNKYGLICNYCKLNLFLS